MQLINHVTGLCARLDAEHSVAFVPTMGNLHEGHLDLVRIAREQGKCVVVSIFVNPLQFGPSEDFNQYPRTLESDCARLQGLADVVFAPSVKEMYPLRQTLFIEPPPIASELCGAFRPSYFRGMATVVLKLFNVVQPQVAVFGKKDYQQLFVVRQMAAQLNLSTKIVGGETIRAPDGLALSSRNQYLDPAQRTESTFLYRTLLDMRTAMREGEVDIQKLELQATESLVARGWTVDYVAVRTQADLIRPDNAKLDNTQLDNAGNLVVLAAAWLGKTRLIDNLEVCLNR